MQNTEHQPLQRTFKARFRGHDKLNTKVQAHYPENVERELTRVVNAYMRLFRETLENHMPDLKTALSGRRHDSADNSLRLDALIDEYDEAHQIFEKVSAEMEERVFSFGLKKKLQKIADMETKMSVREWKRAVRETLGVDIFTDEFNGDRYRQSVDVWIGENAELITTIPKKTLSQMKQVVFSGLNEGKSTTDIAKEIQSAYDVDKHRAQFIARDQISKLNAQITKFQQTDAGVTSYKWSTSGDSRVRSGHKWLNGKSFSWNKPPVVDEKSGRRGHPGEDYQCRCVALAEFDINTLSISAGADIK